MSTEQCPEDSRAWADLHLRLEVQCQSSGYIQQTSYASYSVCCALAHNTLSRRDRQLGTEIVYDLIV